MKLRCDNCGRTYADDNELARVFPDIPDMLARIEPGGVVPHGECPNCGCLVYNGNDCGYVVKWSVNGGAGSFRQAAALALEMQRDPNSTAVVLDVVHSATGARQTIDLQAEGCSATGEIPMRIVIVLEGALVQQVCADAPDCIYAVLDRDTDCVEPDRLRRDPADGRVCTIETGDTEADPVYVAAVFGTPGATAVPTDTVPEPMALLADIVAAHDSWRDCSDTRESLSVWSESVQRARRLLKTVHKPGKEHS